MPEPKTDLYDKLFQMAMQGKGTPLRTWLEKQPNMTDLSLRVILEAAEVEYHGAELTLRRLYLDVARCQDCSDLDCSGWCRGEGPVPCDLMFVGESPGQIEAKLHRSFIGPAGNLLTRLLRAINLDRDQVFITNTVKCFRTDKESLTADHAVACRKWFLSELRLVEPKRVVVFGRFAWEAIFGPHKGKLEPLRQQWRRVSSEYWHETSFPMTVDVAFLYHPAAALRRDDYLLKLQEDFGWLADCLGIQWRKSEEEDEYSYAEVPEIDEGYDFQGKAHFEGDEIVLDFSKKHSGKTIGQIAAEDPGYLMWITNEGNDFPEDLVTACKEEIGK